MIEFHLVVDGNQMDKHTTDEIIKSEMEKIIEEKCTDMHCNIIVDIEY